MIVLLQKNKIIAVDKNLLNLFDSDLSHLNEIICPIELSVNSLKNETLNILSKNFKISEIPLLSTTDIKIFDLSLEKEETLDNQKSSETSELEEIPVELPSSEKNTEPEISVKETSLEKDLANLTTAQENASETEKSSETSELEEIPVELPSSEKNTEPEISVEETSLEKDLINLSSKISESAEEPAPFENKLLQTQEVSEENKDSTSTESEKTNETNKTIVISFEDEFDEISKILSLNSDKAKELISSDLKHASKDLGIEVETLEELFKTLLNQIEESKDQFNEAVSKKDYEALHRIAHSLKGAALNLRLSNIALILKTIDEKSKKGEPLEKIEFLIKQFYFFIDKITNTEKKEENIQGIELSDFMKSSIEETVKNYLTTQNEKKFKKDLKYIKKILNIEINSVEELENLIKV